jgi:S-adenosylmethionine/arginine decarboxylase-like enzyme
MDKFWGYHLMLDCAACDKEKIQDAAHITAFAKDLVKRIDMVAYGEPQVVNFGSGNKAGYTLVQLIETSNICAHFCNDSGDVYFDVFSCKPFAQETVVDIVNEYFKPANINLAFVLRDANIASSSDAASVEPGYTDYK